MKLEYAIILSALILAAAMVFGSVSDYYTFKAEPEIVYVDSGDEDKILI